MKRIVLLEEKVPELTVQTLIAEFEKRFQTTITVHDCHGILFQKNGEPLLSGKNIHSHPFCMEGRFLRKKWNLNCHRECALKAEEVALDGRAFLHRCWKGCSEIIVPILENGSLLLLLYAGPFRCEDGAEKIKLLPLKLRKIYESLPEESPEIIEKMEFALHLLGETIRDRFQATNQNVELEKGGFRERIRRFVTDHAHQACSVTDLASALHLSVSRTCHIVKYHFGESLYKLLLRERITRAKNLLATTNRPIKEVASATGFENIYYFNRMFSRECGMPPGAFRRSERMPGKQHGD